MAQDELSMMAGIDAEDYYNNLEVPPGPTRPTLTEEQQAALEVILSRVGVGTEASLSGAAGTGKTTMISALVDALTMDGYHVVVCTPTNKAATVLNNKGIGATTIHRRFFVPLPKTKPLKFVAADRWVAQGKPLPEGKLDHADIVIVDEASMLGSWILGELRRMCDFLIMVGDENQLPPVADRDCPEGYFNSRKHDATLTKVMRQGEGSTILSLATTIREGRPFMVDARNFFPEESFSDLAARAGIKFLAFTNKERSRLNRLLRLRRGLIKPIPAVGEPMICANNYSDLLLNGTECTLEAWSWDGVSREAHVWLKLPSGESEPAKVDMLYFFNDLQQLQRKPYEALCAHWLNQRNESSENEEELLALRYGYCITAHAAQGSEYEKVCVIEQLDTIAFVHDKEWVASGRGMPGVEAARRWMYTAVTRARTKLFVAPVWYAGTVIEGGE